MTHWNYRIIHVPNGYGDMEYGLYEVYYDGEGKPWGRTQYPVDFTGDSPDEVREVIKQAFEDAHFRDPLEDWTHND